MIDRFLLYYHTIKFLKVRQVIYRLKKYIPIFPKYINYASLPIRHFDSKDVKFQTKTVKIDYEKLTLSLLNEEIDLKSISWEYKNKSLLWNYNLHYFDYINASFELNNTLLMDKLINDWIKVCVPFCETPWEPYPTSLRIVNWIKYFTRNNHTEIVFLNSLYNQVIHLENNIEWHLLGNHLFSNAKALVFAGLFFDTPKSKKWLNTGLKIIEKELVEQVMDDGGNFELSPMYHSIFIEDLLDLICIGNLYNNQVSNEHLNNWKVMSVKMFHWLSVMTHPDGQISFFNDAAIGISLSPHSIQNYFTELGISLENYNSENSNEIEFSHQRSSGYIRVSNVDFVAILDVAEIGPRYLPGHGHADTLSFELSLFGHRVFVNGGTSEYGTSEIRFEQRSTKNHNTVVIDDENSSEVWSGFRVGRRASVKDLEIFAENGIINVKASHDGYTRLEGKPVHVREWKFEKKRITIVDTILGEWTKSAVSRFILHPIIDIANSTPDFHLLKSEKFSNKVTVNFNGANAKILDCYFAPEFGTRILTKCIELDFNSSKNVSVTICWE